MNSLGGLDSDVSPPSGCLITLPYQQLRKVPKVLSPPKHESDEPQAGRAFLNVREAAAELRLDESTLYRHLREGRFPGVKVGGRYLVPRAVIAELVNEAMTTGRCVDVDHWAERWRDERASAALAAGYVSGPRPADGAA